ncbi:hypothetical protein [Helicobacter ibis]|uniref:hypothetical protein n=1 Tax=Helicobacter ibis TaxID=2962633 RepID=UPI0022EBD4E6|nr:hypothetical protein [Helicobacter ibis]
MTITTALIHYFYSSMLVFVMITLNNTNNEIENYFAKQMAYLKNHDGYLENSLTRDKESLLSGGKEILGAIDKINTGFKMYDDVSSLSSRIDMLLYLTFDFWKPNEKISDFVWINASVKKIMRANKYRDMYLDAYDFTKWQSSDKMLRKMISAKLALTEMFIKNGLELLPYSNKEQIEAFELFKDLLLEQDSYLTLNNFDSSEYKLLLDRLEQEFIEEIS